MNTAEDGTNLLQTSLKSGKLESKSQLALDKDLTMRSRPSNLSILTGEHPTSCILFSLPFMLKVEEIAKFALESFSITQTAELREYLQQFLGESKASACGSTKYVMNSKAPHLSSVTHDTFKIRILEISSGNVSVLFSP